MVLRSYLFFFKPSLFTLTIMNSWLTSMRRKCDQGKNQCSTLLAIGWTMKYPIGESLFLSCLSSKRIDWNFPQIQEQRNHNMVRELGRIYLQVSIDCGETATLLTSLTTRNAFLKNIGNLEKYSLEESFQCQEKIMLLQSWLWVMLKCQKNNIYQSIWHISRKDG